MTHLPSHWFFICLVSAMEGSNVVWADETFTKYVCSGNSIQLIQNITIDSIDMVVSLYIKASNDRILGMWTLRETLISEGYSTKVFLDKNGDLWIRNVSSSDEAQYIIIIGKGNIFVKSKVDLIVHAAPTVNCKPAIRRVDDVLVASLKANECGKPLVSVDWLYYNNIHNEGNELMLPRTNNAGIYYACIKGPAVRCATTSKLSDYCSAVAIDDMHDSHDISSEPGIEHGASNYPWVMQIVMLVVLLLVLVCLCGLFLLKCTHLSLCLLRKKAQDVGKREYNQVPPNTELLDIKSE